MKSVARPPRAIQAIYPAAWRGCRQKTIKQRVNKVSGLGRRSCQAATPISASRSLGTATTFADSTPLLETGPSNPVIGENAKIS